MDEFEPPTFWIRKHRNGFIASVSALPGRHPRFLAGAPSNVGRSPYMEFKALGAAMRHADDVSQCPQPCRCPDWEQYP